jgi:hypothetical protein
MIENPVDHNRRGFFLTFQSNYLSMSYFFLEGMRQKD